MTRIAPALPRTVVLPVATEGHACSFSTALLRDMFDARVHRARIATRGARRAHRERSGQRPRAVTSASASLAAALHPVVGELQVQIRRRFGQNRRRRRNRFSHGSRESFCDELSEERVSPAPRYADAAHFKAWIDLRFGTLDVAQVSSSATASSASESCVNISTRRRVVAPSGAKKAASVASTATMALRALARPASVTTMTLARGSTG